MAAGFGLPPFLLRCDNTPVPSLAKSTILSLKKQHFCWRKILDFPFFKC
jgi:hypothetical protein